MKRVLLLVLLAFLGSGRSRAQESYFGLGASLSSSSQYGLKYGWHPF